MTVSDLEYQFTCSVLKTTDFSNLSVTLLQMLYFAPLRLVTVSVRLILQHLSVTVADVNHTEYRATEERSAVVIHINV